MLTPELLANRDHIITLGDNGRYFLLELPEMTVPPHISGVLKMFIESGLTPVITHPERNHQLHHRPDLLEMMVDTGCPLQVTAASLEGLFGKPVKRNAENLVRKGLCHILASDAHWEKERPPVLSGGREIVAGMIGQEEAMAMVDINPDKLLQGKDIL